MADQVTHTDQYKMLRDEIMQNTRTLDTVQYTAAIGAAAVYTWLIVNKSQVTLQIIWFIPFGLLLFCAVKSWDLYRRIMEIAVYLARLEEDAFGDDSQIPGWERYKKRNNISLYDRLLYISSAFAWLVALVGSFIFSLYLSK